MKTAKIYKITNIQNGKIYIGYTQKDDAIKRWRDHCNAAKTTGPRWKFHNAINSYGEENFTFEVLYESNDLEHTLNVMEPKFIIEHNSHYIDGWGYNMTTGGDGITGFRHSEETLKKLSLASTGKKHSEATKKKMSDYHKGKTFSAITRKRLSIAHTGMKKGPATEERKQKIRKALTGLKRSKQSRLNCARSTYLVILPNGTEEIVKSLSLFCEERNLNSGSLRNTLHIDRKYKGYSITKIN